MQFLVDVRMCLCVFNFQLLEPLELINDSDIKSQFDTPVKQTHFSIRNNFHENSYPI